MANTLNILYVFFSIAAGASALQQQLTIYELPDQQGDSVTFTGKYADLSNWTFFLSTAQSFCVTGRFNFFDLTNFEYESLSYGTGIHINNCTNYADGFGRFKSGRIVGPTDLYASALSIYKGSGVNVKAGQEIIITSAASTNFPFVPTEVASFGNSSYTFFTENNFGGSSWCFEKANTALGFTSWSTNSSYPVQSVVKGCNAVDVEYYRNLYAGIRGLINSKPV